MNGKVYETWAFIMNHDTTITRKPFGTSENFIIVFWKVLEVSYDNIVYNKKMGGFVLKIRSDLDPTLTMLLKLKNDTFLYSPPNHITYASNIFLCLS